MRILVAIKLFFLAILTCVVVVVMMPAMLFGGSKFLREVYAVLDREFAKFRRIKKAA